MSAKVSALRSFAKPAPGSRCLKTQRVVLLCIRLQNQLPGASLGFLEGVRDLFLNRFWGYPRASRASKRVVFLTPLVAGASLSFFLRAYHVPTKPKHVRLEAWSAGSAPCRCGGCSTPGTQPDFVWRVYHIVKKPKHVRLLAWPAGSPPYRCSGCPANQRVVLLCIRLQNQLPGVRWIDVNCISLLLSIFLPVYLDPLRVCAVAALKISEWVCLKNQNMFAW